MLADSTECLEPNRFNSTALNLWIERFKDVNLWLYVESNPGDAELVRTLLREHCPDIKLVVTSDGEEALTFLSREEADWHARNPTLILVSLHVPRMEGVELVRQIRQAAGRAKPMIVFADLSDDRTVANCYKAGASCVVPKPFDLDDYVATLKHVASLWSDPVPAFPQRHNATGSVAA